MLSSAEEDILDTTVKEDGVHKAQPPPVMQASMLDLRQPLMMANIGTKALAESKFKSLRDMMIGNQWENNQREYSESTYSFLMINVTNTGYESEGGEFEEAMGQEQSHEQNDIKVTSSKNESSSIANESNPDGNESSSIADGVVSDRHSEGWEARPVQEETYGTRRNLLGQRPLRESHESQSRSSPRILPRTWDLFMEDPTPYIDHPQFIQISPRGFYDAVKEWPWAEPAHRPHPAQRWT